MRSASHASATASRGVRVAILVASLALTAAACAEAQPGRRSPRATVTQIVGSAELSIRYYRPSLHGRTAFPDVVAWEKRWTPGADSATRFETTADLDVEGQPLPAGRYSLWIVPREHGPWSLVFNREAELFHLASVDSSDVLRIEVAPASLPAIETLSFTFPVAAADSAVMRFQWDTVALPVRIHVRRQ